MSGIESFLQAYIAAALWSSTDNSNELGGIPLDKNYGPEDLAPETLKQFEIDCQTVPGRECQVIGAGR